jgi:hypothetical protein
VTRPRAAALRSASCDVNPDAPGFVSAVSTNASDMIDGSAT